MPLHPHVAALLEQMVAWGAPPLSAGSVSDARAGTDAIVALAGDPIPVGSVRDITIPVEAARIGARVYTPAGAGPHPIVMFFHGGGWVICTLDTHDNVARAICRDAQAVVVSVDYRMAPEFRFPTAPNDCFAATTWVVEHAASLAGDANRLAVCGDSAGGNLSAVVSQMARDRGGPRIAFAALLYPATDMTANGGSLVENATGYFLERADMEWFMNHYLSAEERADPRASPRLHPRLTGLPPCFITTCEFDPLRDEGEAYGAALLASGVATEIKRYDGLIHAVANMAGVIDGGREMVADVASRLRAVLHA